MKKTWYQKMQDKPGYPKVLTLQEGFPCYNAVHKLGANAGDKIVIVNPSEVIPLMAQVSEGHLLTIHEICLALGRKHQVNCACTLTTGIFIMTIANAVQEVINNGDSSSLSKVPWWRTIKAGGYLNEKYPGGQETQKNLLEQEGLTIINRGSKYQVQDYSLLLEAIKNL